MSTEHQKARKIIAEQTRVWMHWDDIGEIHLLLNLVKPDGSPSSTVGSCELSHAPEYIGLMMRGLECGVVAALRSQENK